MGIDHPPRDEQANLAKPSLFFAEPADDSLSLLESALRGDEPSLWDGEHTEEVLWDGEQHTEEVCSLLEENARLRGLLVQLSNLILKNVVHAR